MRFLLAAMLVVNVSGYGNAQEKEPVPYFPAGELVYPRSSTVPAQPLAKPVSEKYRWLSDALSTTIRAKTNIVLFVPAQSPLTQPPTTTLASPADNKYFIETPASVACTYGLIKGADGCNPNSESLRSIKLKGGQKTIAIVTAYHAPKALDNFRKFSNYFNLPIKTPTNEDSLTVISASGTTPPEAPKEEEGWETETYLDIEWAHALAPDAKIILIETDSSDPLTMLDAVTAASLRVEQNGGGEVSMSWTMPLDKFIEEIMWDELGFQKYEKFTFNRERVVHIAASGDMPSVGYPASSPRVVATGGTTINRRDNGTFINETAWECSGVGGRDDIPTPDYQKKLSLKPPLRGRGIADLSATADPRRGVWVYVGNESATDSGWRIVGGTSVATPVIAGLINQSGKFYKNGADQLLSLYGNLGSPNFVDIVGGQCGPLVAKKIDCCDPSNKDNNCCSKNGNKTSTCQVAGDKRKYSAMPGWDYCTGVGTPNGPGGL